ncbi:unnamed protein product [Penicillium camemberti]|uniref:Str. FM013 n=1 Tax=Penicillium camemberti (strain FM 013) TaxID=1429867 RepID=A0A0G4P7Y6_PENC3|nr:unnamed protein product [Penicillium camemberti]
MRLCDTATSKLEVNFRIAVAGNLDVRTGGGSLIPSDATNVMHISGTAKSSILNHIQRRPNAKSDSR